jgi:hypothetical protein
VRSPVTETLLVSETAVPAAPVLLTVRLLNVVLPPPTDWFPVPLKVAVAAEPVYVPLFEKLPANEAAAFWLYEPAFVKVPLTAMVDVWVVVEP